MTISEFFSVFWDKFLSIVNSTFGLLFLGFFSIVITVHLFLLFLRFFCYHVPTRSHASDSDNSCSDNLDSDYFDSDSVVDLWDIPDKKF